MKIIKEMNRIMLKLVSIAMVMLVVLQVESIEVKAAEPNYLTFEALEDSSVGFYINVYADEYIQYQKYDGTKWMDWSDKIDYSIDPACPKSIDLHSGERIRFKGKVKEVFFGGEEADDTPIGFISGNVKVSGDITTLTNEKGKIDSLIDEDGNVIAKYNEIFKGCTGLVSAENLILPSKKLSNGCYSQMFEGCTALKSIPKLSSTELAESCYSQMFKGCVALTSAPELPATVLADSCYSEMFIDCVALVSTPELPATTLAKSCYSQMFKGCTSLTSVSTLPAEKLAELCYFQMFEDCQCLINAPDLPATRLAVGCYYNMFLNCKSLQSAPSELPATKLKDNCYSHMFEGCERLKSAPELPATELMPGCYDNMFLNCKSLKSGPSELPAMSLLDNCYSTMFLYCKALTKAPKLPATELANGCYSNMFSGCSSLKIAPELPATELKSNCYNGMFENCSSLEIAPDLLNLDMAGAESESNSDDDEPLPPPNCCAKMFYGCTALKVAPNITVESLSSACFTEMFEDCVNLIDIHGFSVPDLTLQPDCFYGMFKGCSRLALRKNRSEEFDMPWEFKARLGGSVVEFIDAGYYMFTGCDVEGLPFINESDDSEYIYILKPGTTYYLKAFPYDITIEESENGTVYANKSAANAGEDVELTVIPDEGYVFDSWVVSEGVEISDDNTFIMPDRPVSIKAIFRSIESGGYLIRVTNDGHGSASANKLVAAAGELVTLTARGAENYVFDRWESSDVIVVGNKFVMPNKDVIIKAIFKYAELEEQDKKETIYVDYDTFKSELPAGTVLTMDTDNFKKSMDMKVHSLDKKNVDNQEWLADFYASQMNKKAKILHTYGIYTRGELPLGEIGARKVLAWNNLSVKTPGPIYAVCYNQKDGACLISGTVNENGTAVFFDFKLHEATNVTIFTLE